MNVNLINEKFAEKFATKGELFTSPGRINLIGEHTDYILVLIATDKPTTREELMSISGFGIRKWEVWGDEILKVVSSYMTE